MANVGKYTVRPMDPMDLREIWGREFLVDLKVIFDGNLCCPFLLIFAANVQEFFGGMHPGK